ncbi:hypothetical protein Micbo1qcDRAFT_155388 [Microdochium bolleyi]|uniref:Peroxin 20 n=1 Tax=Microdochium bolleyi TaxID=196109 RepID=A0A136JI12_9PEZI|nr:hypothetical protein Micbo1qcDRAFT_155388 [Microdochium bolleyi]
MADAMCGPANALKGLAGHLDRDGSRQQDRFVASPHMAAQNFRSSPAGGSGANAGFAAFQNGNNNLPGIHDGAGPTLHAPSPMAPLQARQPWQLNAAHVPVSQTQQIQPVNQSWISDFQHMNVNGPLQSAAQAPAIQHPAPQFNPMFVAQRPMMGGHAYGFNIPGAMAMQMPGHAEPAQVTRADDDFDFDAAMSQWMAANAGPEEEVAAMSSLNDSLEQVEAHQLSAEQSVLSPETLPQEFVEEAVAATEVTETATGPAQNHDNGELAAAARQVVQSVSNETNDKFAKSDFFAFMRRLGNEEIVLRGTEFVEAGAPDAQNSAPAASQAADTGNATLQPTVEDA